MRRRHRKRTNCVQHRRLHIHHAPLRSDYRRFMADTPKAAIRAPFGRAALLTTSVLFITFTYLLYFGGLRVSGTGSHIRRADLRLRHRALNHLDCAWRAPKTRNHHARVALVWPPDTPVPLHAPLVCLQPLPVAIQLPPCSQRTALVGRFPFAAQHDNAIGAVLDFPIQLGQQRHRRNDRELGNSGPPMWANCGTLGSWDFWGNDKGPEHR